MTKNRLSKNIVKSLLPIFLLASLSGCDFLAKRKCEWYVVPEIKHISMVEPGWASVCLKNYNLGKQKCFLKLRVEIAESLDGKPVRYNDLDIDETTMPRTIHSAETCEGE